MAETVKGIFTEVLIAPGYEPEALELLQTKKNLRILQLPEGYARKVTEFRQISGGVLVQDADRFDLAFATHRRLEARRRRRGGCGHPRRPRVRVEGRAVP